MDKKHCNGCHNDFYNGKNSIGVKECWGLKTAKLVIRFRIGTWTQPTAPYAFTKCKKPSCYHAEGCGFYNKLPDFVKPKEVANERT